MLVMEQVTKIYRKTAAVEELNLHVHPGTSFAILGAIDSGKTSILRMCAGLSDPTSGAIWINGADMRIKENRKHRSRMIGYMAEKDGDYAGLQILEYMEIFAHAAGLSGLSARERCMELLHKAELGRRSEQLVGDQTVSVQRLLSFLRAIIHRPKLLLLDQPFDGMENVQKMMLEEMLADLSMDGTTIVMALDSLMEASRMCSEMAVLERGTAVIQGTVQDVLKHARSEAPLYIRVCGKQELAAALLRRNPQVKTLSLDGMHIMVRFTGNRNDEAALLSSLTSAGVSVYAFHRGESSLNDLQADWKKGYERL